MRKLFYVLLALWVLSCDADRTELPRSMDMKVPSQHFTVKLYEREVLEVTLSRPVSSSPDSTYVEVKNVSGRPVKKIDFYLESCEKSNSNQEDCLPDYLVTIARLESIKDQELIVQKIRKFVDFEHSNKIYVTAFEVDTVPSMALAGKYLYSQIKKTEINASDTVLYSGLSKVYIQTDGTFYTRGTLFSAQDTNPKHVWLGGNISKNNQVYIKDLTQPMEAPSYLFLGELFDKTVFGKANISRDSHELIEIILN